MHYFDGEEDSVRPALVVVEEDDEAIYAPAIHCLHVLRGLCSSCLDSWEESAERHHGDDD